MTLRTLPRSRLDRVLPPLLRECALVVIVPVADHAHWSAEAAWAVARAATTGLQDGRRAVALVDLCLDSPLLHQTKGIARSPGIAEAFAADAPLTDVAHDVDGVYFLSAGSEVQEPDAVRRSQRWSRLQAGFRSERALLLVCLPAERIPELGAVPDGVIALAPLGMDLGSPSGRALLAARERGVELLGVVRERWSASQPASLPSVHPQRVRPGVVAAGAALAIVSVALLATAKDRPTPADTVVEQAKPVVVPVLPAADSGGWTLQLAAYGEPERALAHVDRLVAAGMPAFVSPLSPDTSGTVWYRVLAGAFATRDAAAAARQVCWDLGLAAPGEGKLLLAPYSLALRNPADGARLRATGLAPVRWGERGPVLVGAFEHPEQAAIARATLERAAIATTLITRTDPTP
ncbi:MAG TPA: SPOR domain-containing protein [Gemmatimonadales bacterium]